MEARFIKRQNSMYIVRLAEIVGRAHSPARLKYMSLLYIIRVTRLPCLWNAPSQSRASGSYGWTSIYLMASRTCSCPQRAWQGCVNPYSHSVPIIFSRVVTVLSWDVLLCTLVYLLSRLHLELTDSLWL